jgi:superfamily II DNA or RNA helicase
MRVDGNWCYVTSDHKVNITWTPEEAALYARVFPINPMDYETEYPLVYEDRIPAGLIHRVVRDYTPTTSDITNIQPLSDRYREDQLNFIDTALDNKRGVIRAATSFGKTACAAGLLQQFKDDVLRLMVVPTVDLLYQSKTELERWIPNVEIGIIGDSVYRPKLITVATIQTLYKRLLTDDPSTSDYLSKLQVVIFDEVHRYNNPSGALVAMNLPSVEFKLGITATPDKGILQEALFGPILKEYNEKPLIASGSIMQPVFVYKKAPPANVNSKLLKQDFSYWVYNKLYETVIVNNTARNQLIAHDIKEDIDDGYGPILVLVKSVGTSSNKERNHATNIQDELRKLGIELPIVHGKSKNRADIFAQLENNTLPGVIASSGILTAGVSIKSLGGLVLALGGAGDKAFIQQVGRVLRVKEGKKKPRVRDYIDSQGWFANHSSKRMALAREIYGDCVEVQQ